MKVNFINYAWCNSPVKYNNPQNTPKYNTRYLSLPKDTVSFQQSSKIPASAIEYLNERKKKLGVAYDVLPYYDHKKLEGIQNGIEIFGGMSFPQVAYLINNLSAIALQRGCNNACIHCFANAQTPYHMKASNFTDKMDFEDYEELIAGFKEINKRLGFNAFKHNKNTDIALFYDADCSNMYLRDKNGKMYDYADLAKMLYEVTGKTILFDTAGWDINDKKTQQRMENLVKKIKTNGKEYTFFEFFISMNPFHRIYNKSVELAEKGDMENSKRLREIYTTRTANVIFTLSPLIDKRNNWDICMLNFIPRALKYETGLKGYREVDLAYLMDEIQAKLKKMYSDDLMSDCPKVVHDKEQKKRYLDYVDQSFNNSHWGDIHLTNKTLVGKFKEIPAREKSFIDTHSYNSAEWGKSFNFGVIDINGNFYMTNYVETYPTNITLNYKNKGKPTAPIEPNLRDDIIIK